MCMYECFQQQLVHFRGGSRIPRRRGANPPGGRQHMILPNFAKNYMKLRKFWAVGGACAGGTPLNLPLSYT